MGPGPSLQPARAASVAWGLILAESLGRPLTAIDTLDAHVYGHNPS